MKINKMRAINYCSINFIKSKKVLKLFIILEIFNDLLTNVEKFYNKILKYQMKNFIKFL
jgi:hypothetical protein